MTLNVSWCVLVGAARVQHPPKGPQLFRAKRDKAQGKAEIKQNVFTQLL